MKNTMLLFIAFLFVNIGNAQITLDHTFPTSGASAILFTSNGTKIMSNDTGTNQIKLYNTDYTLWKTIVITTIPGYKFSSALLVSDNLFNSDNNIEFVAVFSKLPSTSGVQNISRIVNEVGGTILDLGDAYYVQVAYIDGIHKLITYSLSYSCKIYRLPGELPCGHCGAGGVGIPKSASISGSISPVAMPNPAIGQVTIQHGLPKSIDGVLILSGSDGKIIGSYPIFGSVPTINIDINTLPSGMYIFQVIAEGLLPTTGTFIK